MQTNDSDPFYSSQELLGLGFDAVGRNVRVSRKAALYAIRGRVGDEVRVDDFAILKGHITIHSHVHISSYCMVSGSRGEVTFENCSGLASHVSIYTGTDSYTDVALNGPTVPPEMLATIVGAVVLRVGALIGSHSVILPGVTIGVGASVGAMCVISKDCEPGGIYVSGSGRPRKVGLRDADAIARLADTLERAR